MTQKWTYIVAEPLRSKLLSEWGISENVVRLGRDPASMHPAFAEACEPPYQSSDPQKRAPHAVVGLYEMIGGTAVAARRGPGDSVEFVDFSIEEPGDVGVIARSEVGLWYLLFDWLRGCDIVSKDELRDAAQKVGFSHIEDVFQSVALRETTEALLRRLASRGW